VALSELQSARGPLDCPSSGICNWQPKTLEEIAPGVISGPKGGRRDEWRRDAREKARSPEAAALRSSRESALLGSQQSLGGKAKAWARWFIPQGSCEWYITEGSARRDPLEGRVVDYLLLGLVGGTRQAAVGLLLAV